MISTINGDSNVPFYRELGNQGIKASDIPVMAFSVGEEELRGIDTKPLVGHLAAWNYFMSVKNPKNTEFSGKMKQYAVEYKLPNADKFVTNDPMEATYVGINMWKQAVEKPVLLRWIKFVRQWQVRPLMHHLAISYKWMLTTIIYINR